MLPTVTKIVFVTKFVIGRVAVDLAVDLKIVQVVVLPTHDDLDNVVQFIQGNIGRNYKAPPDCRADFVQGDFELIDGNRFWGHRVLSDPRVKKSLSWRFSS